MLDFRVSCGIGAIFLLFVFSHGLAATLVTLFIIAAVILLAIGCVALYKKANPEP